MSLVFYHLAFSMLSENIRLIALDFETTGLDVHNDVPIQIGLLEFDQTWNIIWGFQSLIYPEKEVKELKSVVSFITWLSVEKLKGAPRCEELLDQLAPFFWANTVIVWHNVAFDLEFLKKYFPSLTWKTSIDTFRLSQSLIHYTPSYALEILIDTLKEKQSFKDILAHLQPHIWEEENFHDAYYDSKITIALFEYLLQRVDLLIKTYPVLEELITSSDCSFSSILKKKARSNLPVEFPSLKKITASNTQILSGDYSIALDEKDSWKKYSVNNLNLKALLSSLATNKQIVFAFSSKSKLDIAKNILADLGIKNIGFVKEEQMLNHEKLSAFMNKGVFSENEVFFLLKYFSHAEQGLGILELNTKGDFEIYTALKDQRDIVNYPIVLATHWGLFSLLEQEEKYKNYRVVFFDAEWWYKSYNYYLSRAYDLNYTLNYLDMLSYKFNLQYELTHDESIKRDWEKFEEFVQFFTVFMGILWQETKAFFTNTDATIQTLEPLKGNISFYQTNKLLDRFDLEWKPLLEEVLSSAEFNTVWKQIEHMQVIFQGMMIVEKKMWSKSDFYFVYSEEVKFTNREDFLAEFKDHKIIFLTNNDTTVPKLLENVDDDIVFSKEEEKIFHLSKIQSVLKAVESFDINVLPNWVIFVLSVKKDESVALFEELIAKGFDKTFILLVENITWGVGKNLFKAKQQWPKIIIWWYNFLLQLFAQKIAISQLIIYNNKWNQQDLIYSDILRYGQEALS